MNLKFWKNISKKASNNRQETVNVGTGCSYINPRTSVAPKNLLLQNKSFVYACTKKIEQYIAAVPIHTYYYKQKDKSLFVDNNNVKSYIIDDIKTQNRLTYKKNLEIVEITDTNHPLLQFIKSPAEKYSYCDWIGLIASYIILTGNALLEIVEENGVVKELEPIKWEDVTPHIFNEEIEYYDISPSTSRGIPRRLYPAQVIHLKNFAPGNMICGMGNLEACIDSAVLFEYYDALQIALAKNYAMPGIHINVKNKVANKEEAEEIANSFIRKFGKGNTGRPLITFGDIEAGNLSISPKDMEYQVGRNWSKKTICAVLGVPEDLVDVQDSNRASSTTAITQFIQITIYPLLNKILEQINSEIVAKYFDPNAYYYYDKQEILEKDQAQQSQVLKTYVDSGIMTVDEAREVLELPQLQVKETPETPETPETEEEVEENMDEE